MRITSDQLSRADRAPTQAAAEDALGDAAGWMLADCPAPSLPTDLGSALILMVWEVPPQTRLLPGFALPVRWAINQDHDPALPAPVLTVAIQVLQQIAPAGQWGLQRHPSLGRCDLRDLPCTADSAWAALATSLVLAVGGLRASPQVALTGAWSTTGLIAITHLATKAQVARRLGIVHLFAPAAALAPTQIPPGLTLSPLPTGVANWHASLDPALRLLAMPPAPQASLEARWAYADLLPGERKNQYLITCGAAAAQGSLLGRQEQSVGTLVSLLSSSAGVVTATALRPQRVVFIHTERDAKLAIVAAEAVGAERLQVERDDDVTLGRLIEQLCPDVLDLQGATKRMALVAALAAPQAGLVVLDGEHVGSRHRSGGEHLVWVRQPASHDASPLGCQPSAPRTEEVVVPPLPFTTRRHDFTVVVERAGTLPPWKGSLWRGLLGHGLLAVAAGAPTPPWFGLIPGATFIDAVFDPQRAWGSQQATAPWTLQLADERTTWAVGDRLCGSVLLHGPWPDWAEGLLVEALRTGLALGMGAERIPARLDQWSPGVATLGPTTAPITGCRITLRVPARLQDRSRDCTILEAPAVARALLRRAQQLALQTVGSAWLPGESYRVAAQACDGLIGQAESQPSQLARWSNRQERTVCMATVTGALTITGPMLATAWPWLSLAPLLNIGKQAHLGLGVCILDDIP